MTAREALAEEGATTGRGPEASRDAVDAAVAPARSRRTWRNGARARASAASVVERAEADGLARAKVLSILDELGQA